MGTGRIENPDGFSELHEAAIDGETEFLRELLEATADINETTKDGDTALHLATLNGNSDIVEILLNEEAAITKNGNKETAKDLAGLERTRLEEDRNSKRNSGLHEAEIDRLKKVEIMLQEAIAARTEHLHKSIGVSVNGGVMWWYAHKVTRHWFVRCVDCRVRKSRR